MAKAAKTSPEPKATFVFQGTVKKVKAALMRSVPVDAHTAVVHVDQVLEAPANLRHLAGMDLTVQLVERVKASAGDTFVFHAAGWIFGDTVALRAVTQEPLERAHAPLLARGGDPVAHRADRELQDRVNDADLVVSGTVVAVKLPEGSEPQVRATRGSVDVAGKPVSEHDPKWREAVVQVADVHKGEHAADRVSVLFPSSQDVRWFKAPKFHAGQQGYFVLQKSKMKESDRVDTRTRGASIPAEADKEVEVYTALHPDDFHPYTQPERIRASIDAKSTRGKER
ncbi:MAG TPA: hypothetical protein VGK44_01175 [Casimicrobiaceae bacterium]|jgi:hypothetical protein